MSLHQSAFALFVAVNSLTASSLHNAPEFRRSDSSGLVNIFPDTGTDGSRGSLHVFREESPGLFDLEKGERITSTATHEVTFMVKLNNMEELTRIFHDVSDPDSENYGNHMTQKEVNDLTSNVDSVAEVVAYLRAAGATITPQKILGDCVSAEATIHLWERMFDTEFHSYSTKNLNAFYGIEANSAAEVNLVRTERYSIPWELNEHVASVINTIQPPFMSDPRVPPVVHTFNRPSDSSRFSEETALYRGYTTPQLVTNAYFADDISGHPRATQAAFEGFGQVFSPLDLLALQKRLALTVMAANRTVAAQVRTPEECKLDMSICVESTADIALMISMSNTPTYHYYTEVNTFGLFVQETVNKPETPPLVISISYSTPEFHQSVEEIALFNSNAMKLGVMGTTIFVSSGDDGVANHFARSGATWNCGYKPKHPASSPYVTSIGATQVRTENQPERHTYFYKCFLASAWIGTQLSLPICEALGRRLIASFD